MRCLSTEAQTELAARRQIIIAERERLAAALAQLPDVAADLAQRCQLPARRNHAGLDTRGPGAGRQHTAA